MYDHVGPKVTSSQDGKVYKMEKIDYAWLMTSREQSVYSVSGRYDGDFSCWHLSETSVARSPQQNGVVKRRNFQDSCQTLLLQHHLYHLQELIGIFFQSFFDELLTPLPNVDHSTPKVIAPIAEVVALEPAASIGSLSLKTVDQDALSPSNSQTTPETQSPSIPNDVEEDNHELDVAHINNNPFFGIPIPETKDHSLENIIGQLARPVSTGLQLHEQALFCYYDTFFTTVEPKTYKDALTQSCWIEAMQKELNEFERHGVWELEIENLIIFLLQDSFTSSIRFSIFRLVGTRPGSLGDKIICDLDQTPDLSQRPPQNCLKILQDSSEPSKDNTNIVNALQEPFVVKQDLDKNSSRSPPQINHRCCYECGDPLEDIFCHQCTCEFCGKDGNSFTYDSKSNLVHDSPNVFDPPPQTPLYSCEFYENDARYGHYCTPQVLFIYPEPCYNQDFNFP
nr:hypothetical protein [Tanacetum cinerariifolium]